MSRGAAGGGGTGFDIMSNRLPRKVADQVMSNRQVAPTGLAGINANATRKGRRQTHSTGVHNPFMQTSTMFQFPGQGSQAVGMGASLAESFPAARAVFDEVNTALGEDLFALMRDGPEDELRLTRNAQPALFASSMAALRVLCDESGRRTVDMAGYVAGHSLGEYSALAAAGSLTITDAARLLRLRGESMQKAVPPGEGAMAAMMGGDEALVGEIVTQASAEGIVEIANDNAPGQIVVSGATAAVERAIEVAGEKGVRRALRLPVSAPFHCRMMQPAADVMAEALADAAMQDAAPPVLCNVTADAQSLASALRDNLVAQVTGRVRWRETLVAAGEAGVSRLVEIGTGKVLSGLAKRTLGDATILNLATADDLDSVLEGL